MSPGHVPAPCVNGLADALCQASIMGLLSIHMRRILWFKSWSVESPWKKAFCADAFIGEHFYGKFLEEVMGGKKVAFCTWKRKQSFYLVSISKCKHEIQFVRPGLLIQWSPKTGLSLSEEVPLPVKVQGGICWLSQPYVPRTFHIYCTSRSVSPLGYCHHWIFGQSCWGNCQHSLSANIWWIQNLQKSVLNQINHLECLGLTLDTALCRVFPSLDKLQVLCCFVQTLWSSSDPIIHFFIRILGLIVAYFIAKPSFKFHSRLLQTNNLAAWDI